MTAAGCGDGSSLPSANSDRLHAPEITNFGAAGKMVSGVPEGIYIQWTRNTQAETDGYYLYRDTQPIPTPPPDETLDPALRTNGGNLIDQPGSGSSVSYTDIFPVVIGTTYYYRVTAVDSDGNESYPSNEVSWLVHGQTVTGLSPTSAFWGDDVTLMGDTFGTYDAATDSVLFQTVDGSTVEGAIVSWNDTEIVATVPNDVITGPVYVVVGGTFASTDDDLQILNPYITDLTPAVEFVERPVTISGANFGASVGSSSVTIGATDVTSGVTDWQANSIELVVPDGISQDLVRVTVNGLTSNGRLFRPKPEILSISRTSAAPGAEITIDGRYFGNIGAVRLGTSSEIVTQWTDTQLLVRVNRVAGHYPLTVERPDGAISNAIDFEMLAPLTLSISGIDPQAVYTPDSEPTISLAFPGDTDEIRIWVDGVQVYASTPQTPQHEVVLDVDKIRNGIRSVNATASGRGVAVNSNTLTGTFFSLPGDLTEDGNVNIIDLNLLPTLIGLTSSDPAYRPWFDTDGDGVITEADASLIGYAFGNQIDFGGPSP